MVLRRSISRTSARAGVAFSVLQYVIDGDAEQQRIERPGSIDRGPRQHPGRGSGFGTVVRAPHAQADENGRDEKSCHLVPGWRRDHCAVLPMAKRDDQVVAYRLVDDQESVDQAQVRSNRDSMD